MESANSDSNYTATQPPAPVIIIGAGPSGLLAALILTELNIPVEIYDRALQPSTYWRAPGVLPRTLEAFARLGVVDTLLERGVHMQQVGIYIGTKRILGNRPRTARTEYPFVLSVPQTDTEAILRDRLEALNVSVQWGWSFVDYSMDQDNVTATLQSVVDIDTLRQTQGCYIIGCDGSQSAVRNAIGAGFSKDVPSKKMIGADILMKGDWNTMRIYWHPNGAFGIVPVGNDRYRAFTKLLPSMEKTPEAFVKIMQERVAPTEVPNISTMTVAVFTVFDQVAQRFRSTDGRVFLCGDAAHVQDPVGAQGMNSAIGDAENLTWKLGLVIRGMAHENLLMTYEDERKPFVVQSIKNAPAFGSFAQRLPNFLQRWGLRLLGFLFDSLPRNVRRVGFERSAQLSYRYNTPGAAVLQDTQKWTAPRGWRLFARQVDLCAPGARAINSTLLSLTRKQANEASNGLDLDPCIITDFINTKQRLHDYQREYIGQFIALVFIDEQLLNNELMDLLATFVNTLQAHLSAVAPPAIVCRGMSDVKTMLSAATQIYDRFSRDEVRVLIDQAQAEQYDRLTMTQLYNGDIVKAPAVYLIRPDAYIACRTLLSTASDRFVEYLTNFLAVGSIGTV
ncbi:FAD binding domain-containing protein [Syncephalis fuscata]|nr:FAD binding domain-containing protein [Syncephalis fuscata]